MIDKQSISFRAKMPKFFSALTLTVVTASPMASAIEQPGEGSTLQAIDFGNQNTRFQTEILRIGLERLGYEVEESKEASPPIAHLAVGNGDVDYMAVHWTPLHESYYQRAGGDEKNIILGTLVHDAVQGILIDKKTAEEHGITSLEQLADPELASLFDVDGNGKADLAGCNPGWGCEQVIQDHLSNLELQDTVEPRDGVYQALISETLNHYRQGKPVLYYSWTPMWVNNVMKPGRDVVWLHIPEPGQQEISKNGQPNLGFESNDIHVMANKKSMANHPAASRFLELATIDIESINEENALVQSGEDSRSEITGHAEDWIADNQSLFNEWLEKSREVGSLEGEKE